MIGKMAADRRMIAEHFVFNNVLARNHRVEKVRNMDGGVVVALGQREALRLRQRRRGIGMLLSILAFLSPAALQSARPSRTLQISAVHPAL